jgi:large subunit ribosomal protein L24
MGKPRNVRKEDQVLVIAGKDRGKRGRVLRMMSKEEGVIVEGVHLVKRHTKPNPQKNVKGGIVEKESPVHVSNLMVICGQCGKPVRVGYKTLDDGRKVRTCRKCNGTIDK